MNAVTRKSLFFIGYAYVVFRMFEVFTVTLLLSQLGVPNPAKTAMLYGGFLTGASLVVVMSLRPMLERELVGNSQTNGK